MAVELNKGFCEVKENEMCEINGGGVLALVGTVTACLALGKLAYECGEKMGQTLYVLLN